MILLSLTVLSRVTLLSRYVWSLHRHVSSVLMLLNMVLALHATHKNSQNSYSVHDACVVLNSKNSLGDGVVRGRGVCVPGETESLSTSTRCVVRRLAVDEYAHPQQVPLKLHVETWAGLLQELGL